MYEYTLVPGIGVNIRSHQSAASHENEPEYYTSRDEDEEEEEEEEINNHGPFRIGVRTFVRASVSV